MNTAIINTILNTRYNLNLFITSSIPINIFTFVNLVCLSEKDFLIFLFPSLSLDCKASIAVIP